MPLVRFEVRNEYGMGDPELYGAAVKREDPKAVFDGLAVAGLVGILRQLGDMAEFAADIFHDLHEEIIATSARGRKVMTRVKNIEAALPSLEKSVKGQTSHIHLAYIQGSDWHARLGTESSQLLSSDLPRFMMDSYEECRDPPRLYLLDKFDNGGAGTCLKRYSDPTFFQKAWDMLSKVEQAENAHRENTPNNIKRKESRRRSGGMQNSSSMSHVRNNSIADTLISSRQNMSRRFTSVSIDLQSVSDNRSNPDLISRSTSFGSKSRFSLVDHVADPDPSPPSVLLPPGNLPSPLYIVSAVKKEETASEAENYLDALNTMEPDSEPETEPLPRNENGNGDDFGNQDSQGGNYGNGNNFVERESSEISEFAPADNASNQEIKSETSSVDLDNESEVETSPRVSIKPKNTSNLYELPEFSEITPLVLPAQPISQKMQPSVENTIMEEPCSGEIISQSELHAENFDSTGDSNAKIENNETYITDENKFNNIENINAPFITVPSAKLWTNAGLFGLEPSKPPFEKDSSLQDSSDDKTGPNGIIPSLDLSENIRANGDNGSAGSGTPNLSSSFSSLAQRFLTNTLQKRISPSSLSYTNTSSRDFNFAKSNESKTFKSPDGSFRRSGQSSPPLECMKIFSDPSNGCTDKNAEDPNPLFSDIQILPGPYFENGSDSDGDTFCQSYVYSSDDNELSPVRHSNSDVWDQEKFPEFSEQTDLPGIESVVFSSLNKNQNDYDEYFVPQNQENENEVMPPPPPLPPAQWRLGNNKSSVSSSAVPLPPSLPSTLFQPKFVKKDEKLEKNRVVNGSNNGKEANLKEEVLQWHINKLDEPKKEVCDAKDLEERVDMLDQIRNKSFNLRRTMTSKPNPDSTQTPTNSSVSAILEKANALRQAFVGSDDGRDDDSWSDV